MKHQDIGTDYIHIPYNWTYADAAAREGASGLAASDVGKVARQLDDDSLWMLVDDSPVTWVVISARSESPVVVKVNSLNVLTSTTPADIGTITVPSWLTRYVIAGGSGQQGAGSLDSVIAETAAGTLAGAAVEIRDASGGGGNLLASLAALPTAAGGILYLAVPATTIVASAQTLHVRQTTDSANAGTISVYLTLMPLL